MKSLQYEIGKNTLIDYVSFIEDSFFMFSLPIFSYKVKNRMQYPKKHYFIDNIFLSKISSNFSNNYGRLYENLVAVSLLKKEKEIFYWKNQQQQEVDFVVKKGLKVHELIQVCYDVRNFGTEKREVRALISASKELKCKNLLIITKDKEGEKFFEWFGVKRKIKFVPLWKWLLGE